MAINLESLASIGVLTANGVFMVIAVAGYLKMNAHELRRQQYIAHALGESRDAGHMLRNTAIELMRMIERAERAVAWQRQALTQPQQNGEPSFELDEPEPDTERLRALDSLEGVTEQRYEEWKRLQEVELERLLSQRRRLLAELEASRKRADEAERQAGRSRTEQGLQQRSQIKAMQDQLQQVQALLADSKNMLKHAEHRADSSEAEVQTHRGELERLKAQLQEQIQRMERDRVEKDFIEDHLLALDKLARRQQSEATALAS
ncbi:hypothetical protein [Pelomonas sp. SE-A7]|uniref:hypothetical protein n=1 Tax=Pelomonas sp. SE-A7 TaxID=3054953 RepID=UPI00259D2B92|nr:hypothetical protein [Pelomonas sp. SE-A7]MDM4764722.1 hypothetical protein [Pelomonas sp. SE-A7]